jgi:hypothetical protein
MARTRSTIRSQAPPIYEPYESEIPIPNEAYARPPAGYPHSVGGYADQLETGIGTTPDAQRVGTIPIETPTGPNPGDPAQWYEQQDRDTANRESVVQQQYSGIAERVDRSAGAGSRFAPNPNLIPPQNNRWTQYLNPNNEYFVRPFAWGMEGVPKVGARYLNGVHFSMASHKRNYEIFGMAPRRQRRNTLSRMPAPWDENIVDVPPPSETVHARIIQPVEPLTEMQQNVRARAFRRG